MQTLMGYIGRTEVKYVLGMYSSSITPFRTLSVALLDKARKMQNVSLETACVFLAEGSQQEQEDELGISGMGMGAWPAAGVEELATPLIVRREEEVDVIKMWPWVNQVCFAN